MTLVMETESRNDYRLERWIAVILALLFFLPFVARADVRSGNGVAETVSYRGSDATMQWQCKDTGIDGFSQCALVVDGKVATWRMAPRGEELIARVNSSNDTLEIARVRLHGRKRDALFQRVSYSSRRMP
jgi:hypothetical protein